MYIYIYINQPNKGIWDIIFIYIYYRKTYKDTVHHTSIYHTDKVHNDTKYNITIYKTGKYNSKTKKNTINMKIL